MNKSYSLTAIKAVEIGGNPKEAWQKAAKAIMPIRSPQEKGCPKTAFLGLCEEGLVKGIKKGIKKGKYTRPYKGSGNPNKTHAINAFNLLKKKPEYADLKPIEL